MTDRIQCLRVKDWDARFESSRSREYKLKGQTYMPNKQGLGYNRIMHLKDGCAIYGAWCAMINLLSRMEKPRMGYLTDNSRSDGIQFSAKDISNLTLAPLHFIEKMLELCRSQHIGWLEVVYINDTKVPSTTAPQCPSPLPLPLPLQNPFPLQEQESAKPKKAFGELSRVMLTQDEYDNLVSKNGSERTKKAIEILDSYIASKNVKYACHYAVMKTGGWVWDRVDAVQKQSSQSQLSFQDREMERKRKLREVARNCGRENEQRLE